MKKVILEPVKKDVVSINKINNCKTYIADFQTGKYKLHRINNHPDRYVFAHLLDSDCWANGTFKTMEDAVRTAIEQNATVYEISNMTDFIECLEM